MLFLLKVFIRICKACMNLKVQLSLISWWFNWRSIHGRTGEAYVLNYSWIKGKKSIGWIGYTLSWSKRQFDELNGGEVLSTLWSETRFSIVLTYKVLDELSVGATWFMQPDKDILFLRAIYFWSCRTGGDPQIQYNYAGINTEMFPAYTKLDINLNYSFKWLNTDFETYLTLTMFTIDLMHLLNTLLLLKMKREKKFR